MMCIDMLIWEYRDCLRLLDGLGVFEKFRTIRGLVFIDKPLGLSRNPAYECCTIKHQYPAMWLTLTSFRRLDGQGCTQGSES